MAFKVLEKLPKSNEFPLRYFNYTAQWSLEQTSIVKQGSAVHYYIVCNFSYSPKGAMLSESGLFLNQDNYATVASGHRNLGPPRLPSGSPWGKGVFAPLCQVTLLQCQIDLHLSGGRALDTWVGLPSLQGRLASGGRG